MRTRQSAAYKGIHALLMREGAKDFRSGQGFDHTIFFDEAVDIHHIFPAAWCEEKKIDARVYDTVINKTPLSYRTNRIIGGVAPSKYLHKLEQGRTKAGHVEEPPIERATLDSFLKTHCIPVDALRADRFEDFMNARQAALLSLISTATGHHALVASAPLQEGEELTPGLAIDSGVRVDDE